MTVPADFLAVPVSDGTGTLAAMGPDLAAHSAFHAREATAIGVLQNTGSFTLFDHTTSVGNVGTGEDDLYTDTLPAGLLAVNGDKIEVTYGGIWVVHGTATRQLRIYFGGTVVVDSTAYASTAGGFFGLRLLIQRVSASVVRTTLTGAFPPYSAINPLPFAGAAYTEVTGLTLANTQILKITGEAAAAGAATNDIIAKHGYATFHPAA